MTCIPTRRACLYGSAVRTRLQMLWLRLFGYFVQLRSRLGRKCPV